MRRAACLLALLALVPALAACGGGGQSARAALVTRCKQGGTRTAAYCRCLVDQLAASGADLERIRRAALTRRESIAFLRALPECRRAR